jgi:hypothetical protein
MRALIAARQNLRFCQLPSARELALLALEVFFWSAKPPKKRILFYFADFYIRLL